MIYYVFCGIVAVLLFSLQTYSAIVLLTPRDVGGTLFGGMFLDLMCIQGWLLATAGFVLAVVLRLAAARVALLCAGSIQMAIGIWSLVTYPYDMNEYMIYSPTPSDIYGMLCIIGSLLFVSIYLLRKDYLGPKNSKTSTKQAS
ncbi:MAG: hypothetical protein ACRC7J_10710 [Vibrio ordalii]|uniref:hypothetical protein n=1 Tax=Vibrio ordalii TaxID=28174 RepID=UPI003F369295